VELFMQLDKGVVLEGESGDRSHDCIVIDTRRPGWGHTLRDSTA
jgi:hypothetical protein